MRAKIETFDSGPNWQWFWRIRVYKGDELIAFVVSPMSVSNLKDEAEALTAARRVAETLGLEVEE